MTYRESGRYGGTAGRQISYGAGTVPPQASDGIATHGIRAGQKVFHAKFGEGDVLSIEGKGADAKAKVNFGRHGTKLLLLAVAKLTVV